MTAKRRQTIPLKTGFTLIEVLVVVAIIALLVAILLPSLGRAREQARIVACSANMSSLSKAVFNFVTAHKGYGQLIPSTKTAVTKASVKRDPGCLKYDYEVSNPSDPKWPTMKMWPVAYARELGYKGMKSNSQYFDGWDPSPTTANNTDPGYYVSKFGLKEVFLCPSDKARINGLSGGMKVGMFSYGVNEDVFGAAGDASNPGDGCYRPSASSLWYSHRLDGRMDDVDRPSEVVLFADSGRNDPKDSWGKQNELISTKPSGGDGFTVNRDINGPYLENFDAVRNRLGRFRHGGGRFGVSVALSDGSGRFAKATEWIQLTATTGVTDTFARQYLPKVRVTPYGDAGLKNPSVQP